MCVYIRRSTTLSSPDVPSLPQCLPLEPIMIGNQKYTRFEELRFLGVPHGSTQEDHSFGVGHLNPPMATKGLTNFKDVMQDASEMARDRAKVLQQSIFKLDRYREALGSTKRQQTDLLSSERCRSAAVPRQQIVIEKDRDMLKVGDGGAVQIDDKVGRLLVGGGGWDKKMKRNRFVGAVGNRAINGERDMKRAMHVQPVADTKLCAIDAQRFRSRALPGMSGIKLLESFVPTNPSSPTTRRNELEGSPPLRDCTSITDEMAVAKINKSNIHEENPPGNPRDIRKWKAWRTPITDSVTMLDSSATVHPSSGALGGGTQPANRNNVPVLGVANNEKRPMSTSLAAHHMAQRVGQKPLKILRTTRENLISPLSNNDETRISSQGLTTSDHSTGTPYGTGGSVLVNSVNNNPNFQMELKNFPPAVALSEGEDSGGGEIKLKEKGSYTGQVSGDEDNKAEAFIVPSRKNKVLKGENRDGLQSQGSGRQLSWEKIENPPGMAPLQRVTRGSEKSRSKFGLPPSKKLKLTDCKTSIRAGNLLKSGSSDFKGESDDDREELLAAANYARNASKLACSGPFWKHMECYFASISSQDESYLKQQLNLAEEFNGSLSQRLGDEYNALSLLMHKDVSVYSGERQERHSNKKSVETDDLCEGIYMRRKFDKAPSLYQRVLSALIEEDENEELYHQNEGRNMSFQSVNDDSHCGSFNHSDVELKDWDRLESEIESEVDLQAQKHCLLDRISCNESALSSTNGNQSVSSALCNNEKWQADDGLSHSDAELVPGNCQNDVGLLHSSQVDVSAVSSFDNQYQMLSLDDRLLLELQSIGVCPEITPHHAEGDKGINQKIMELQAGLHQQAGKLKHNLGKIDEAIPSARDVERWSMEQAAMNQLIVMAYKNQMAFRRSNSSKSVLRRVSKKVALAFANRTLARCRKFDDTGESCFSESVLQDVIFSAPPCNSDVKSIDCVRSRTVSNRYNESFDRKAELGDSASGDVSCTPKRYEYHSDNMRRGCSNTQTAITHSPGQAFFKREPILNKGKNRELLLNNVVVGCSSKATSVGEVKGKRSEINGDQKSKPKAKKKDSYLPTSRYGLRSRFMESSVTIPRDSSKEKEDSAGLQNKQLTELGSMDIGASNSRAGDVDFSCLLNFNEDGLQEHD